jgi:D-cysteine desulfhydrase
MNLGRFKRRHYTGGPTPLEFLPRLSKKVEGPNIYVKRDDLLGLAGGGSKTRKLEFLMAEALDQQADIIITCGAVQSNHCRLTLAAAIREGLDCHLVLEERVPGSYDPMANGNNLLFELMGRAGITVVPGGSDMAAEMEKVAEDYRRQGHRPYVIPVGGSNPTGDLGYLECVQEIEQQMYEQSIDIDRVYVASGSGGTHAALVAGLELTNANIPVVGICINNKSHQEQCDSVYGLVQGLEDKLGLAHTIPKEKVVVCNDYVGDGYSLPTPGMVDAVKLAARTEGLLLDPVYTGKAMAGMLDLIAKGAYPDDKNVLFVHTGGLPALFCYKDVLLGN